MKNVLINKMSEYQVNTYLDVTGMNVDTGERTLKLAGARSDGLASSLAIDNHHTYA
jgi:S-adenosylmethionine synthetase